MSFWSSQEVLEGFPGLSMDFINWKHFCFILFISSMGYMFQDMETFCVPPTKSTSASLKMMSWMGESKSWKLILKCCPDLLMCETLFFVLQIVWTERKIYFLVWYWVLFDLCDVGLLFNRPRFISGNLFEILWCRSCWHGFKYVNLNKIHSLISRCCLRRFWTNIYWGNVKYWKINMAAKMATCCS